MNYELFTKTVENRDHTRVCRFCLTDNALRRIDTKTIADLYNRITNDKLLISCDVPALVCNRCESNLKSAAKIRSDITEIEKCWNKYIDQVYAMQEVKKEDTDDENVNFETVEMIIEPVDQMYSAYDADYLDADLRSEYGMNYEESRSVDGDSVDNFIGSASDSNDNQNKRIQKHNCEHCKVTGLTRVELKMHLQSSHPELFNASQYKCDICQARYSSRYGIRTHMKRHMQGSAGNRSSKRVKRYHCSKCDERFSRKMLLEEHELRHLGASLHVCHICGIGKKAKSLLNAHLKTHDPDYISKRNPLAKGRNSKRYFTCWICPTRIDFQSLTELKNHRKELHHGFQCKFCKNGFMTNEALQSHMLIHGTQDRPHQCKFCGGTFAKIGHLKSHIQGKHAEQKPFPCEKCPKGFVHRYQLQSHIRIFHDKIKAFQCSECPTSFGHAKSRLWHMRTVHKM